MMKILMMFHHQKWEAKDQILEDLMKVSRENYRKKIKIKYRLKKIIIKEKNLFFQSFILTSIILNLCMIFLDTPGSSSKRVDT